MKYRVVIEAISYATYEFNAVSESDAKERALDFLKQEGLEYDIEATVLEDD